MDLLQAGSQWLESMRDKYRSTVVTFMPTGGTTLQIPATTGRSQFELVDGNGLLTRVESRDYLITASSLAAKPKAGDQILDGTHLYQVNEFGSEPAWRWSDPFHRTYRIHCKEIRSWG